MATGDELSEAEVADWKRQSQDDKLYDQTLRFIALRQRSTWEIEQYLVRKKVDPLLSQQILNKLSKSQFVDDLAFARAWISNRRLLKPMSRRRLQQELRTKHVAESVITDALGEDTTDDSDTLRQVIAKKRQQSRYQDATKLMQYLARQGYAYENIKQALSED